MGVHQTTATKLAYPGYPALHEALQHDLLNGATPAERVRRRLEHAGADGPLESLIACARPRCRPPAGTSPSTWSACARATWSWPSPS